MPVVSVTPSPCKKSGVGLVVLLSTQLMTKRKKERKNNRTKPKLRAILRLGVHYRKEDCVGDFKTFGASARS